MDAQVSQVSGNQLLGSEFPIVWISKQHNQKQNPNATKNEWIRNLQYNYSMKYYTTIKMDEILYHLQPSGPNWRPLYLVKKK